MRVVSALNPLEMSIFWMIFAGLLALGLNCVIVLPPTKKKYEAQMRKVPTTMNVVLLRFSSPELLAKFFFAIWL